MVAKFRPVKAVGPSLWELILGHVSETGQRFLICVYVWTDGPATLPDPEQALVYCGVPGKVVEAWAVGSRVIRIHPRCHLTFLEPQDQRTAVPA